MRVASFPRLLADVGGTHARLAWQSSAGAPSDIATFLCAEHDSLLSVVRLYLAERGHAAPKWACVGIANPVTGDRIQMTNHPWSFSISELKAALGLNRLVVINDFTALALALPALQDADLHQIGQGSPSPGAARAVLGPGTGLGVSGLLPDRNERFLPIDGEGGHVTLAPSDEREAEVIECLRRRFGHVSAERALSGPGLVNLYQAACAIAGRPPASLGPSEVIAGARRGDDPGCVTALDLFFGFLGSVAGDLALTLGARGGVFIGGGIAPRIVAELKRSAFRERFEAKGRFAGYLSNIPTYVIESSLPAALLGAARALDMED